METTKSEILKYLKGLKSELAKDGIKKIGLFGSFAKETATQSSDIDIVILADKDKFKSAFKGASFFNHIRAKLERHFKKSVDLCAVFDKENLEHEYLKGVIYV